ncbi:MAG TPA: hypothetical protein VJ596_05505 [Gemmatimonadaceae bacterium]|nr:hypothetical protein [Gemmatimonadaceae bacterium]
MLTLVIASAAAMVSLRMWMVRQAELEHIPEPSTALDSALIRDSGSARLVPAAVAQRAAKYGRMMTYLSADQRLTQRNIVVGTTDIGADRLRMIASRSNQDAVDVVIVRPDWMSIPDQQLANIVAAEILRRVR